MKKEKKRTTKMDIMPPGTVSEFWETILRLRDAGDPRWLGTFSRGIRYSAEMYERNRNMKTTCYGWSSAEGGTRTPTSYLISHREGLGPALGTKRRAGRAGTLRTPPTPRTAHRAAHSYGR